MADPPRAEPIHPGQQVGVATLTMARIQQWFLGENRPPRVRPTQIDPDDMIRRMGPKIARQCEVHYRKKAPDFYREAVRHAHEMRNRFSFADLACGAGRLDELAAAEI